MAHLEWYWHRLRAMTPAEVALHGRKKLRQFNDARRALNATTLQLDSSGVFPKSPQRHAAPVRLREALARDVERILAGRWRAFGHLELVVDDPPKWHRDYLASRDLATSRSAFKLDHRTLPGGADIKLIWELSRWHDLVRLAMAGYVLEDETARRKCVEWLEDWVTRNPPYRGWNWTSALEAGIRLVQFTWIDALLSTGTEPCLTRLRATLLPPHVWYVWRHRSFGSSANNHLLGELAGCILATVRWPALAVLCAPLEELQACWEAEVLAQFAEDGGNREQALNYHLFALEFCVQASLALEAAGRKPSPRVQDRLASAARFFTEVQAATERWDYGDSDDALVTPFFADESVLEWRDWLKSCDREDAIQYWLGPVSYPSSDRARSGGRAIEVSGWSVYAETGIAVRDADRWRLRWDVSPLGYLSTASHGHCDALHVSLWVDGCALIIDPGTGAYYGDSRLREWLASPAAHNGPCPVGIRGPRRLGPFLWADHHRVPVLRAEGRDAVASLHIANFRVRRRISEVTPGGGWKVEDACLGKNGLSRPFTVRWQLAPECEVEQLPGPAFLVTRGATTLRIEVSKAWEAPEVFIPPLTGCTAGTSPLGGPLDGLVSPAFRKVCRAPYLQLTARPSPVQDSPLVTTFLAGAR
jgi:Heparinase II/III-like protein/Heparinase II/III N-terminus